MAGNSPKHLFYKPMVERPVSKHPAFIAALLVVVMASVTCGKQINDVTRKFTFNIPDAFIETPNLPNKPNLLYAFKQKTPYSVILIGEMPGTIGQDNAALAEEAARFEAKPFIISWKTFELIGFEFPVEKIGVDIANFSVQVPLMPSAIQVSVLGSPGERDRLKALLKQVVGSVQGDTNWLPGGMRWLKNTEIVAGIAAIIAAFIFGRRKRKPSSKA